MSYEQDSIRIARRSKTYATIDADTNLLTEGPNNEPCIRIRVGGTGNLALVYADGTADTITDLLAGDVLDVQARQITDSGTTVTKVTVFW